MKKNRNAERRRRENRGAEGAEGVGVSPSPPGEGFGEGAVPPPQKFLILDHEIAFLAHSGRYIVQFSCLLYAQNPAINM